MRRNPLIDYEPIQRAYPACFPLIPSRKVRESLTLGQVIQLAYALGEWKGVGKLSVEVVEVLNLGKYRGKVTAVNGLGNWSLGDVILFEACHVVRLVQ